MKKIISFLAFAAATLTAMTGFAQESSGTLLYKVSGGGLEKPSYILGTHHLASVEFVDKIAGLQEAFDSVDAVVGELLMNDMPALQQALMPYMAMPEGNSYESMLSEEDYALLDQTLQTYMGAGLSMFGGIHPVAISTMCSQVFYAKAYPDIDLTTHVSIDRHFQDKAAANGKKVMALETVEDQVYALFLSEPIETKTESLMNTIKYLDFAEKSIKELTEAYYAQDIDKLHYIAFENPEDPNPMTEEAAYALVKERNDKWMLKLPCIMKEQPTLIVVGALHLTGEEGLIHQLRQSGYTVEPVK